MSLSRPVTFPLLKLPFLCIKCVLHNSDEFVLIYFATISNRTRRIVKASKFPPKEIDIHPIRSRSISIGDSMDWYFIQDTSESINYKFALQRNSEPLRTCRNLAKIRGHYLESYTAGDTLDALKMGIAFLIDVFRCQVSYVTIGGNELSELIRLGISTVKVLRIDGDEPVNITDLNYSLENIKVTVRYVLYAPIPEDFYCDPQIFNCRELYFGRGNSADWVTVDVLCQFDVSVMHFWYHRFSVEDIVAYITHWFHSENRKLEYVVFQSYDPSLEDFKIERLNPMPFCKKRRNRYLLNVEGWEALDMSNGKDILRQDGLLATLLVCPTAVVFYVWHKRFPDDVQQ